MEGKDSFVFYISWFRFFDKLKKLKQREMLRKMIQDYVTDKYKDIPIEEISSGDDAVDIAFVAIAGDLKKDLKRYKDTCKKNKENIDNYWKKKKNETIQSNTTVNDRKKENNKNTDNECEYENDNEINKNILSSKHDDAIVEIIDYLNQKTGKHFKSNSKATKTLILARLKEGCTVDEFKKVIDNKCYTWLGTEQEQYLRPETLFRPSHFESYLNETIKSGVKNNPCDLPNGGFESLDDRPAPSKEELERWRNEVDF